MNFEDAGKALQTIEAGNDVEFVRGENRRKINDLFNGVPPIGTDDARKQNLKINVNWGEGTVLAHHARRQYANAFIKPKRLFKVQLFHCDDPQAGDWGKIITKEINRPIKRSRPYTELIRNKNASIVSHGIGAQLWRNGSEWCPEYVSIENLRIPTDTRVSLDNLEWFAVRTEYTPGELSEKVFGEYALKGWNKKAVQKILKAYHKTNFEETNYDWNERPEKLAELYKQNGHFYSGDAVPSINLWHLYFLDRRDGNKRGWKMRVLPDRHVRGFSSREPREFLFNNGNTIIAEKLERILFIQFGDLSNKAPFLYHSVRSLGFMLFEPCLWTNLSRCRLLQHLFESLNILFRTADPAGRARAQKIELFDRAVIPEGVGIVGKNERHQIDSNLVTAVMAQLKQLMQEVSASYTQELDTGTKKEQTAYETSVKMSLVNAMLSGLLAHAFSQETFAYYEIGRRFCDEKNKHPDAKRFRRACIKQGVPRAYLTVDEWDIEPEIPIGAGNPVAEITHAKGLMEVRQMLNPTSQQEVLHDYVAVMTDDPKRADRLVPMDESKQVSAASKDAEFSFPLLMRGLPARIREELNLIDQIETYIGLLAGEIEMILRSGGTPEIQQIIGLRTVEQHVTRLIERLAQDETQQQLVREFMDSLGKLMNEVKGFEQRAAEAASGNGQQGADPEMQTKMAKKLAEVEVDEEIKTFKQSREEDRNDMAFSLEQERKDAETEAEIERNRLKAESSPKPSK